MVITFDRAAIVAALDELVTHLGRANVAARIRIVGGAAIALQYEREAVTTAIDALYGREPAVEEAAHHIARSRGWRFLVERRRVDSPARDAIPVAAALNAIGPHGFRGVRCSYEPTR